MSVPRLGAAVLLFALGAEAARADEAVPERRPEPMPLRLQAPLLRPVFLPAPAAARAADPDVVERANLLVVSVFRESDSGPPGSGHAITVVGDAVAGVARFRVGLPSIGTGDLRAEYGFEIGAVRYGRSPKFRDEGPVLAATYAGATWLDLREPAADWLAPSGWILLAWPGGGPWGAALQAHAALPGGSRARATGTRARGGGVTGLVGVRCWAHAWLDLGVSYLEPGRPRALGTARVPLAQVWQATLSLAWAPAAAWSFHLQAVVATNPFPATGTARLDEPLGEVTVGCRWRPWADVAVGLMFAEDLTRLAPDFTAAIWVEYRLRGRTA
jgi:hypothetical protein